MTSQIQRLIFFISQKRTYEEVAEKAYQINPDWRESTWTRGLRGRIKAIGKNPYMPPSGNNPIVAYEPENTEKPKTAVREPYTEEVADNAIRTILKRTELTMTDYAELNKALKKDLRHKIFIIEEYD